MMRVDKKRLIQFMDGIVDVTVLVTGKRIFIQIIAAGSLRFGRITVRAREEDYSRDVMDRGPGGAGSSVRDGVSRSRCGVCSQGR